MKKAALSMRITEITDYNELRDEIAHDWYPLLTRHKLLPFLIPGGLTEPDEWYETLKPDIIIFSGGGDVPTAENQAVPERERLRDRAERSGVEYACRNNIPLLGVCRGMHFLNYYFGGKLIISLRDYRPQSLNHVASTHDIKLDDNLKAEFPEQKFSTNSYHNTGIDLSHLSGQLEATVWSSDGVIEAFRHKDLPVYAVQWHPERNNSCTALDNHIFSSLLH